MNTVIDRIELGGLSVEDIRKPVELMKKNIVVAAKNTDFYLHTKTGIEFSYIRIDKKNMLEDTLLFNSIYVGMIDNGRKYSKIDISVSDEKFHNLYGLTVDDIKERLEDIKRYMADLYGIILNTDNIYIQYMEVQRTIRLDNIFDSYRRAIEIITSSFPRQLRLKNHGENSEDVNNKKAEKDFLLKKTYIRKAGVKGLEIAIYDKTHQLNSVYGMDIKDCYLRFEIKLKTSEKIKRAIGTNVLSVVTQNMIEIYFHEFINKNVIEAYEKQKKYRVDGLKRTYRKAAESFAKGWIKKYVSDINDIEDKNNKIMALNIDDILKPVEMSKVSRQQKYYIRTEIKKICSTYFKRYEYDINLLFEIFAKLSCL